MLDVRASRLIILSEEANFSVILNLEEHNVAKLLAHTSQNKSVC